MDGGQAEPPIVMRQSRAAWLGGMFAAALIGLFGVFMLGLSVMLLIDGRDIAMASSLAAVSGVFWVLFRYVLGDAQAKRRWRVTIGADALELDLPRGRSVTHHLDPLRMTVRFDEIEAVETRLEAYRSFGMVNMNRAYALRLKTGDLIVLGEDRARGVAGLGSDFFADAVGNIIDHGQLPMRERGMAEGQGGILGVLVTRPPPWDAPNLSASQQAALQRRAALTGALAMLGTGLVLIAVFLRTFL